MPTETAAQHVIRYTDSLVESSIGWQKSGPRTQVPLSHEFRSVPLLPQMIRNGSFIPQQAVLRIRFEDTGVHSRPDGILARHRSDSARRAYNCGRIPMEQFETFFG